MEEKKNPINKKKKQKQKWRNLFNHFLAVASFLTSRLIIFNLLVLLKKWIPIIWQHWYCSQITLIFLDIISDVESKRTCGSRTALRNYCPMPLRSGILVMYYCITNYPKFSVLEQQHLLSHSVCKSRFWFVTQLGTLF